jgi:hypothetical protein
MPFSGPTNREIFATGQLIDHFPCDWNPVDNVIQSNGCVEAIYQYGSDFYWLYLNFAMDMVYDPDFIPIKKVDSGGGI